MSYYILLEFVLFFDMFIKPLLNINSLNTVVLFFCVCCGLLCSSVTVWIMIYSCNGLIFRHAIIMNETYLQPICFNIKFYMFYSSRFSILLTLFMKHKNCARLGLSSSFSSSSESVAFGLLCLLLV